MPSIFLLILTINLLLTVNDYTHAASRRQPKESLVKTQDTSIDSNIITARSWLNKSWLKSSLLWDTVKIEGETVRIELLLNSQVHANDYYNNLKSAYEHLSQLKFEEYLLIKFSFLLEVPKSHLIIDIKNKAPDFENYCFRRIISFNTKLDVTIQDCRDAGGKTDLKYSQFKPTLSMQNFDRFHSDEKSDFLLAYLCEQCRQYFTRKGKDVRFSVMDRGQSSISFKATNLANEVISKTVVHSPTVETLEFTILCYLRDKDAEFSVNVNGKLTGYHLNNRVHDMEEDHKDELEQYVKEFTNDTLVQWLKK